MPELAQSRLKRKITGDRVAVVCSSDYIAILKYFMSSLATFSKMHVLWMDFLSNADQHGRNVQDVPPHFYFVSSLNCGGMGRKAFLASLLLDAAAPRHAL